MTRERHNRLYVWAMTDRNGDQDGNGGLMDRVGDAIGGDGNDNSSGGTGSGGGLADRAGDLLGGHDQNSTIGGDRNEQGGLMDRARDLLDGQQGDGENTQQ